MQIGRENGEFLELVEKAHKIGSIGYDNRFFFQLIVI